MQFLQFIKSEKHLQRSAAFSKTLVTLLHGCFLNFLNCKNGNDIVDYVFFQELERPPKDIVTSKNGVWFKASLNIFYGFGTIFSVISLNAFKMTEILAK